MHPNLVNEIREKENQALPTTLFENLGIRVINHLDLKKYNSIEEVAGEDGCIVYIPIQSKTLGHFASLWLNENKDICHYFCSYGYNLKYTAKRSEYLQATEVDDEEWLVELVKNFILRGGRFFSNEYRYQSLSENISTCGRYAVIRLIKKNLNHDEFKIWFTKSYQSIPNDEKITLLTYLI